MALSLEIDACPGCGAHFMPRHHLQRYCTTDCQKAHHNRTRPQRKPSDKHRARTQHRLKVRQAPREFVGIDGEGTTGPCETCPCPAFEGTVKCRCCGHHRDEHRHIYVLLSAGRERLTDPAGLEWETIFEWLYEQYQARPHAAFVGFFLGYDFTQWLRSFPEEKAATLLTKRGQAARYYKVNSGSGEIWKTRPVMVHGQRGRWEVTTLGDHRLSIRPASCECRFNKRLRRKCRHPQVPFMHICDAGPFFQQSFLSVIAPDAYPAGEGPCGPYEYKIIQTGKLARADAKLSDEMVMYNSLEVDILARVMHTLDEGFRTFGIVLSKDEWYGPGAASAHWLKNVGSPRCLGYDDPCYEHDWWQAANNSYFGGWFEIMAHGQVGTAYAYDINSAYPHQIAQLPCLCGSWKEDDEWWLDDKGYALVYGRFAGQDPYIGAHLHRTPDDKIMRPLASEGWVWGHELNAARRAGLIDYSEVMYVQRYQPCDHPPPLRSIGDLYAERLVVGKKTPRGKAAKLLMNSAYGKLCQSVGSHPWQQMVWAGLITAGTRAMILDAIATHPQRSRAVLMVATDAVYFTTPHPGLDMTPEKLGAWEEEKLSNLCIAKPGFYWAEGRALTFKARGISVKHFEPHKDALAAQLAEFSERVRAAGRPVEMPQKQWPIITFPVPFALTSARLAAHRRAWDTAGKVTTTGVRTDSVWPGSKRGAVYWDADAGFVRSMPPGPSSVPSKGYGGVLEHNADVPGDEWGWHPDGPIEPLVYGAMGVGQWA